MAEIITCPSCKRSLQIPGHYVGQKVQCPDCGHMFTAVASSVSAEPMPAPSGGSSFDRPPGRSNYDDDDQPRRRRNRFDDEDDDYDDIDARQIRQRLLPHRGGLIMALGLISLIGGWLICLPVLVGPVAWFMAQSDLRAIRDGQMDPTGESMVRTGQVCGIISTVIIIVGVLTVGCFVGAELSRF